MNKKNTKNNGLKKAIRNIEKPEMFDFSQREKLFETERLGLYEQNQKHIQERSQFYKDLSKEELSKHGIVLETHYIIPLFAGGRDIPENRLYFTKLERAKAHYCRYLLFGNAEDKRQVFLIAGSDEFSFDLSLRATLTEDQAKILLAEHEIEIRQKDLYYKSCTSSDLREQGLILEKHHVVPSHVGGDDSEDNIVLITSEDHAFAHLYRFCVYGRTADKLAACSAIKSDGNQSVLNGKQGGLKNQTELSKSLMTKSYKWIWMRTGEVYTTLPKGSLADIGRELYTFKPVGKVPRTYEINCLLTGKAVHRYGWQFAGIT